MINIYIYIKKSKIKTYGDKVYTNFRGLNVPEDNLQCRVFKAISIDSKKPNITCKYILKILIMTLQTNK